MTRPYPSRAQALLRTAMLAASVLAPWPALAQTVPDDPGLAEQTVDATIVEGEDRPPVVSKAPPVTIRGGNIALNFPEADVRVVAEAVLGELLDMNYTIDPGVSGPVTVVTARPIARASVIPFLEDSLAIGGFALVLEGGRARIERIQQGGGGVAGPNTPGFGTELVELQFVNADQMRALIAPILPNVVSVSDPSRNVVLLRGTSGQRASARELLAQFDVNWLRNMSFALIVPKRTDARVIVPELERLINAPDSPIRDLVRIIAMEKLNGILAISRQRQYLDDVNRWIEILDRQGQNNEPRLFVYKVQNSRSRDLARTLNRAFGRGAGGAEEAVAQQQAAFADSGAPDGAAASGARGPAVAQQGYSDGYGYGAAGAPSAAIASKTEEAALGGDQEKQGGASASGPGGVQITSDDTNNAILVYGTPRQYAVIEDALRKLDVPPVQVMIEAAITEVSLTDDLRYGLQWNFIEGNENAVLTDSTTGTGLVREAPGFSFLFGNASSITGVLNALEGKTKVNVVSAPKLMTVNNGTASLQVGTQVPVLTQNSTSTIDPNAPVINAIEYRDTGVILKITPRVNGSGLVLLDISQEVSDVLSARAAGSGINSPTISTRKVSTTVAVQDGEVMALGGLIRNIQTRDKAGIPFLSQIPIIGGLFGKQVEATDKIELVILLKPRVIRTADDARAITEELRLKIRSLEPFSTTGEIP
ncbi:MAG: type II secretion system secretin GspD [Porphyrobacter sp.]|nr:type II secretion system secretin GspD [Porphyrobacter sp.]